MASPAEERVYIRFMANVNPQTASALLQTLDDVMKRGVTQATLLISSGGGNVLEGLSIFNYCIGAPLEIDTHNFGSVDSVAVVIYAAGSRRYTVPDARFLIHPVGFTTTGNVRFERELLAERLKGITADNENLASAIANRTGKTKQELLETMFTRTVLNPEEAVAFGLVHEVKRELFPAGATVIDIPAT